MRSHCITACLNLPWLVSLKEEVKLGHRKKCAGRKPCDNRGRAAALHLEAKGRKGLFGNHQRLQRKTASVEPLELDSSGLRTVQNKFLFFQVTQLVVICYDSPWKLIHPAYHLGPGHPWNEATSGGIFTLCPISCDRGTRAVSSNHGHLGSNAVGRAICCRRRHEGG